MKLLLCSLAALCALVDCVRAGPAWDVRLEEPTGLYPRSNEVVRLPLDRLPGQTGNFIVVDPAQRELPWQVADGMLMFPVSLIPGELPVYRIGTAPDARREPFASDIHVRQMGLHRLELGNDRLRIAIDTRTAAIVEAFSLPCGPQRMLNYVETSPESPEALRGDIHEAVAPSPLADNVVAGENTGWISLGGTGPFQTVELLEQGPLRGRVRLGRTNETWELTWYAHQGALRWKAGGGFRFAAVSAAPYLPFDRCLDGSEYHWPTGPDGGEPPDHDIGARPWDRLPGGHAVYYRHDENYGALGIVALDTNLTWKGVGTRRFEARGARGQTEIALTFPQWRGSETVLEARKENHLLRQPVIPLVLSNAPDPPVVRRAAARIAPPAIRAVQSAPAPFERPRISLSGEWELMFAGKGEGPPTNGWRTVRVPGTAHVQWLPADDIYSRAAEWVSGKEWWYRRRFRVPESFRGRTLHLQFEATDYYADVWLNGRLLGRHEGYIDPYEFDVTGAARFGEENELLVRTWTPVQYYWKHRPYTIKGAYGAVDQKPDDITPLGITRPVWLRASDPVWLDDVSVATWLTDGSAEVAVELELAGEAEGDLTWQLTLSPRNFDGGERLELRAPATERHSRLVLPVANARLWWTWDHGRPNLYTLDVRLLNAAGEAIDGRSLAVGIREIERVGWTFYLNRKRFFVRGSNYYYHLYLSEMDRAKYERDLRLMLGMNVNMIRLHCHFSNREFYELADEQGVLIWQDFLEAWYPQDRTFSLRAAALYDSLIRAVRNHPCIATWATCDEEDFENYRDLTKHLAPRPAFLDAQRRAVVRSTGRFGDAHVYHGWYDGSIWEYAQMTEEFVSELGATALPNYETLIRFMPHHWPIADHADEWTFRRLQIDEAMRAWGSPAGLTLQEYIPRTQAYVSRLFQLALERMRRLKYHPAGGILHFHAIDIWPSVTMAAIDFERRPTAVYETVRRSFEPVVASLEYDRDRWAPGAEFRCGVWAINDRWEPVPGARIRWRIVGPAARVERQGEFPADMTADCAFKVGEVRWIAGAPGAHELRAEVVDAEGRRISENVFPFTVAARE